jgi:hypothetical protein
MEPEAIEESEEMLDININNVEEEEEWPTL